jgi:ABC-2 type transport system permease protein
VPTTGSHEGLATAAAPAAAQVADGSAHGYRPWRTMPFWVEMRRQASRRRTQIALGFLVVLPFLLVAAFTLGDDSRRGNAPALVDLATTGAANFTFFTLFAATGFLLVVEVALFAGDTVASEASWSSLRYLLASPVPRSQLLRRKLLVALTYSMIALVLLPAVAYVAGGLFFGWNPLRSPLGTTLGTGEGLVRIAIAVGYLALSLLFVAALAFLCGVWTDAPLGAVGGAVLMVIVSNILDAVTALGDWRQYLPTHYQYAWTDVLGGTVQWESMARGMLWSTGYSILLLLGAWRHFLRKDVVS